MRLIIRIKLNKMRSYFIAIKLNYLKIYRIHEGIFYYKGRDKVISLTFVENEKNYIYTIKTLNLELFVINVKFLFILRLKKSMIFTIRSVPVNGIQCYIDKKINITYTI